MPNLQQPIRFQGQWLDEETGLYYNRYRYYDPKQGRYITQDPIGLAGGFNSYAYVSNPTAWVDPLGLYGVLGADFSSLTNSNSVGSCAQSGDEFKQCVNVCLQNNYGSLYEVADNLNPLSVSGFLGNEVTAALESEAQKRGTRNLYGNYRDFKAGQRQLKTLSQFRKFNVTSLVVGAGAIGFQIGAQGYCRIACIGAGE